MNNQNENLGNWFVEQLNLYQSANSDNDSIKRNFIIRKAEFELIISTIKSKKSKDPLQHELILGRRGSGKSTLLKRIQIEVDENLSTKYFAINLAEEQASIYRLFDLWIEVINELEYKLEAEIKIEPYSNFKTDQEFTRYLFQIINDICSKEKKKIILLLDNFDRIVENFSDDGNLLREMLINENNIQIIAGSTRMDEHFWSYDKPFYEFFRRHRLDSLSSEEIDKLITHWSETLEIPQLKDFAQNNRGKIENIRILTDGLPRTLQLFIQILLQNSQLYGYDYLRKIMDNVTPLYQERLNNLTPQFRKIISEMAFIWEACTTKQLVEKCRMESKLISANLKTLVDKGIVDKIETSKKNHLYRISERFFNMWLIITQGNPDQKRKAKWLSIFLENWYNSNDFKNLAGEHIENLKSTKLGFNDALLYSKALSQCKYVSTIDRDRIIDLTQNLGKKTSENLLIELPKKYSDIENEVMKLIDNQQFEKAILIANDIENEEDGEKYVLLGDIYYYQNDFKNSEKYLLLATKKQQIKSFFNLGFIYESIGKINLAEKYYLEAISHNILQALNNLGLLYFNNSQFEKSEKYYIKGIEKGIQITYLNISLLYYNTNKNKLKSLEYIRMFNSIRSDLSSSYLELIIEIWNGIFNDLEQRILNLINIEFEIQDNNYFNSFVQNLLIHQQKKLILNLFQHKEIGIKLKDKYSIIFYVALILNNSKEENLQLKIPPEIIFTVEEVIEEIKDRQKFYGY